MNFGKSTEEGYAKKVPVNTIRAKNLIKSSEQTIKTAKKIILTETTSKTVIRELYEGLREYCEAIGYIKGYKFNSHEVIVYFIEDILKEKSISIKFDRYRKIRNGISYYGNSVNIKTVEKALKEIPMMIKKLTEHIKY
ncbi:hypothetical protein JW949_00865 [Candidatus Woesearchaeota archaeon]|nr:hypothetical protein [Candidatus Woesearchaeota archaeon]